MSHFLSIFLLCLLCNSSLYAQSYLVQIDAEKGIVTWYRDGVQVQRPRVRKGDAVQVRVQNFNNYLYIPEITERSHDMKAPAGGGASPLDGMKGFGGLFQSFSATDGGQIGRTNWQNPVNHNAVKPPSELVETVRVGYAPEPETTPESQGQAAVRIQQIKKAGWAQIQILARLETALNEQELDLMQLHRREQLRAFSVGEVEQIKFNPHLPPSRIKHDGMDILSQALNLEPGVLPTLQEVFKRNDDRTFLASLKLQNSDLMRTWNLGLAHLQSLNEELAALQPDGTDARSFRVAIDAQVARNEPLTQRADVLVSRIDSLTSVSTESDLQKLIQLWQTYETIATNDFSTTYQTTAQYDQTVIDVAFMRRPDIKTEGVAEVVRLPAIAFRSHGGIKVNTSVGLSIGAWARPQYSYAVIENTIFAEETDRFAPLMASYLHFYRQGGSNVSVGGSLGLGIPLGGELSLGAAQLMLGPSLFFGNAERFVLTTGVTMGKTQRLTNGLRVGDLVAPDTDVLPTVSRYALGYAVGLSFNLKGGGVE